MNLLLRGRLLTFLRRPEGPNDVASYRYEDDGALFLRDGLIAAFGAFDEVRRLTPHSVETVDHRPHLIMPGLIDPHIHFPQMQVVGSYAGSLLEWLNGYTFIEEQRFADASHGERIARHFFDELIRHGTTTAAAYCSVHRASADCFFVEARRRDMRMIAGKVMMDRNAPEALCDTPQSAFDDSQAVIDRWHGEGRGLVAITPRFAITSSPAQMEVAGALTKRNPDLHVQTHLSENREEIAFAERLYPDAADYTDIYARYDLLGEKTLLGHAIHLSDREVGALAETGSVAVSCPTSNLFLGSGLFGLKRLEGAGVRTAFATDIGGGTSYSMFRTMDEAYKVQQLQGHRVHPLRTAWHMTRGNAEALSLVDKIGTLDEGTEADVVVLNASATPAMALKMERATTLAEELFLLQTMGDDRAVHQVYVAGRPAKTTSPA
ncbi:guanine deaminase [Pararhizobium haloflavum]|uniref:guanine deaminase n=1 Tax=Pararhizobium haloflavum TaxID=2037914 RepID=UPI000C19C87C|nr:guanine deaminase [Pararhizobium haloflavum]